MTAEEPDLVELDPDEPIWERIYTVSPLVVIGTRGESGYNLAPKHMAFPLAWTGYFGFVCTPRHRTYWYAKDQGAFTVSYPRPDQVTLTALAASPRDEEGASKPVVERLPTRDAEVVDALVLEDAYAYLECEVDRIVDDLAENSLLIGRIVAARAHPDALQISDESRQEHMHEAPLLGYLYPDRYAVIEESYTFPFPEDFER